MAKAIPTRTIGALHLEDLEPHRFEDLVRQLAYYFRPWRQLEATGRSGSDDGFDARGFEGGARETAEIDPSTEHVETDEQEPQSEERIWLIQCKREKAIAQKKMRGYLDAIPESEVRNLYGIIFAAACDFSKTTRDLFRSRTRELGFAEAHLWGKAELEDMLFQPKNDHLLFAYCGISLQIRKRSLRTDVRARVATKRKATKVLEKFNGGVLVRDASDERYPFLDPNEELERIERGRWRVYELRECRHDGVHLVFRRHLAFLDDDGASWDFDETYDHTPRLVNDPWQSEEEEEDEENEEKIHRRDGEASKIWDALPEDNKAWYEQYVVLPYENILAIDEDGDNVFKGQHIYTTPFHPEHGPFEPCAAVKLENIAQFHRRSAFPDEKHRVRKFPREDGAATSSPSNNPKPEPDYNC
jgi:hypothetical protein